jgi:cytoskeletal protein CcmA (bactofilin family)
MFKNDQNKEQTATAATIIGQSVHVEGDFNGNGNVNIEGKITGNLTTTDDIVIGQDAEVKAEIKGSNIEISGIVNGNISASGDVALKPTARLLGDIKCQSITIEKGAVITGKITMQNLEQ